MEAFQLENIKLSPDGSAVVILDQSLLPNEETYISLNTPEGCWEAIYALRVRGAPAIGIFAGYAMYVLARQYAQIDDMPCSRKARGQGELPREFEGRRARAFLRL